MSDRAHPIDDLPTPDPSYSPGDAVMLQLGALRTNDDPYEDAGILTVYNFASPANRRATGTAEQFVRTLESPRYSPMVDFEEQVAGPVERTANYAERTVTVTGPAGRTGSYEFRLSLQASGTFRDCWMTDELRVV